MLLKKGIVFLVFVMAFMACDDLLEEPDISENEVQLLAPVDGVVITGNQVNFNWSPVEDSRSYQVQLAEPDFDNARQIVFNTLIEEDSLEGLTTQIANITLLNGEYQWRVKAINAGFETAYTTASFTINGDEDIDVIAPNTPELVAPENNSTTAETEINFSWTREAVSGTAERDSVYVYTDEALQELSTKGLGANNSYTATLASGASYYWVVQAFDEEGNSSEDSETYTFTIN